MSKVKTTFEVWNGLGDRLVTTENEAEAYRVCNDARVNGQYAKVHRYREWACGDCGATVYATSYDADCGKCGACYSVYGQRLNRNWRSNRSNYDEDVSDLDGYEDACVSAESAQ